MKLDVLLAKIVSAGQITLERAKQLVLRGQVLEDGLDDELGACHGLGQVRGRRDAPECRLDAMGLDVSQGRQPLQVGADVLHGPGELVLSLVMEPDLEAGQRELLGDPVAHEPGAHHRDPLDL